MVVWMQSAKNDQPTISNGESPRSTERGF